MSDKEQISIRITSMWSEHMDAVEIIEKDCFEQPWTRKELEDTRKKRYHLAKVAIITPKGTREKIIAGSMFVEQDKFRLTLLSLSVRKDWRRHGIGTALIGSVIKRLRSDRQYEIYELVRETNLRAQKFYSAQGFVALRPKQRVYENSTEDAYPMVFRWEWSPQGRATNGEPEVCSERGHLCTACGECD